MPPFKTSNPPARNVNDLQQEKLIPIPGRANDMAVNEERGNLVPMQSPAIPWPAPESDKPMRIKR
jgi:hypothetical protein